MLKKSNVYLRFQGYENVEEFTHLSVMTIIPTIGTIMNLESDLIELYPQYFKEIDMDEAKWQVSKITESIGAETHSIYITLYSDILYKPTFVDNMVI